MRGILLAAGGAALISFDGLLIRLQDLTPSGVIFWRGLLSGAAFSAVALVLRWSPQRPTDQSRRVAWWSLLALAGLMVLGTLTWVFSLTHTSVANTLVIVACSPLATGVLGRILLQEHLPLRTWLAGMAALLGVVIVVFGSVARGDLQGDLWAILNTVVLALMLITLRRYQNVDRVLALALSGFLVAAIMIPWGVHLPNAPSTIAASIDGFVVVPGGLILITLAPRYLPAAEVGLLLLLETILAPLWVLLAIGEALTTQVLLSGAIILGAIVVHSVLDLRAQTDATELPVGEHSVGR
jgi:drug/metabolite transporter (DMT)-like permease